MQITPEYFWDQLTPYMFSCLMRRLNEPNGRDYEIARLTAYMVVGSFTKIGSIGSFYKFPWDSPGTKGKTLSTQEEVESMIEGVEKRLKGK